MLLTREEIFLLFFFFFSFLLSTTAWAGFCLLGACLSLDRSSSQEYLCDIDGVNLQSHIQDLDSGFRWFSNVWASKHSRYRLKGEPCNLKNREKSAVGGNQFGLPHPLG